MQAWYLRDGHLMRALRDADNELFRVALEGQTTPEEVLRDRIVTSALDLFGALDAVGHTLPMGVPAIDAALAEALGLLRGASDLLASLPLDLAGATRKVRQATPLLVEGYSAVAHAAQQARRINIASHDTPTRHRGAQRGDMAR